MTVDHPPSASSAETITVPPPQPTRTPVNAWWTLAVLMMFYSLAIIDRQVIALLVQDIKHDLMLSDMQISLVLGPAFFLPYVLVGIPIGWLADRTSRRLILFVGVNIWALAALSGSLASTFVGLLVCRCFIGVGEAALAPSAYSLLAESFPRHRLGFAVGLYQSSLNMGSAIAFGLGGYLMLVADDNARAVPLFDGLSDWRLVLLLTSLPGFVLAPLIFTAKEPRVVRRDAAPEQASNADLLAFLKANARLLLLLGLGFACVTAMSNALTAWTPAYVDRQFGWPAARSGPWLGTLSAVTAIALVFKGHVIDWLYARGMPDAHVRFYTWLAMGAFPLMASLFWIPDPQIFLIGYGILQIFTLTFMVFLVPAIQIFTPERLRGRVIALFLFAFALFGSIGPVAVSLVTDYVLADGRKLGVALFLVVGTFGIVCLMLLRLSLPHLRVAMQNAATIAGR